MSELALSPEPRPLGKSGIIVSPIAWGMWRFSGGDVSLARERVVAALDAGITLLDTADVYGPDNQEAFGAAEALLGGVLAQDGGLRDRFVLATKGGIMPGIPYDSSPAYLASALDASLQRMRVDHIDLYQIHRPDLLTHPAVVAETLAGFVKSGKVRAIGVSNHTASQTAALQSFLPFPLVSHQPEFSPLATAPLFDGVIDQAMANDMAVMAWSPLGGGRLVGRPIEMTCKSVASMLHAKAEDAGVSTAAVAYSWIMAHPSRPIPIVGSQQPERIREANDAFKLRWTRTEWYQVLEQSLGHRLP